MFTRLITAALSIGITAPLFAVDVYVTSSGTSPNAQTNDQLVVDALIAGGHTVTLGLPYNEFDSTIDLTGIDVVYLQASWNWTAGNMPDDGQ
ncbi:MAG: hypothetical protein ACNA8P_11015, partial [Phycisphaerales bacterium]